MIPKIPHANKDQFSYEDHVSITQRLIGVGTILLGSFTAIACLSFVGGLEGGPLVAAIVVVIASVVMVFFGVVIGFPDYLPKKMVAGTFLVFGILSMLMGATVLIWFGFNIFVARQQQFQPGMIGMPIAMVVAGFAVTATSWAKLRGREDDD